MEVVSLVGAGLFVKPYELGTRHPPNVIRLVLAERVNAARLSFSAGHLFGIGSGNTYGY